MLRYGGRRQYHLPLCRHYHATSAIRKDTTRTNVPKLTMMTGMTTNPTANPVGGHRGEFSSHSSFQFLQRSEGTVFHAGKNRRAPDHWILLDSQSTVDVFHNKKLLKNTWESDAIKEIHCTLGVTTTNMVSDLAGYGTVWYHPNGIANIFSLTRFREHGCHITYNNANRNQFIASKHDGGTRIFEQPDRCLFYMDTINDRVGEKCS
jgi:hypothetical protein